MPTLPLIGDPELLLRLRLKQVCEKYRTAKIQKQELQKEINELINKKIIIIDPNAAAKLIKETLEKFGTNINLE